MAFKAEQFPVELALTHFATVLQIKRLIGRSGCRSLCGLINFEYKLSNRLGHFFWARTPAVERSHGHILVWESNRLLSGTSIQTLRNLATVYTINRSFWLPISLQLNQLKDGLNNRSRDSTTDQGTINNRSRDNRSRDSTTDHGLNNRSREAKALEIVRSNSETAVVFYHKILWYYCQRKCYQH